MGKAQRFPPVSVDLIGLGLQIFDNGKLAKTWSEILTDRHHIDPDRAEILHERVNFFGTLSKADHNPALCDELWARLFRRVEDLKGALVGRAWSNSPLEASDGL